MRKIQRHENFMMLSKSFAKKKILPYMIFFVISFLSGCFHSNQKLDLSEAERTAIEPLFRYLLFDNHGAFVLFGSKPMCDALLPSQLDREEAQKMLDKMPEHLRQRVRCLEMKEDLQQAWEAWEKIRHRFRISKYVFARVSDTIFLVNVENVKKIMNDNYSMFEIALGGEFSPEGIVWEMLCSHSVSWKKLLQNHIAMGLLYGFGKDNAERFMQSMHLEADPYFSTDERVNILEATASNFSIPIFVSHPDDPLVQLYEKEKQKISRQYKDKDIVDISLRELTR
ncbi:MAG: hypothetical protein KGR16_06575 [Verrucomicrobia bacterium]|nr:hypothetical protein [Verrucomicrobiota bacterium]